MSLLSQFYPAGGGGVPIAQGGDAGPGITVAELLLVGGGGSSSPNIYGGQAGAVLTSTAIFFTQGTSYTITIGSADSESSVVGGTLNLIAPRGNSIIGTNYASNEKRLDEYTQIHQKGSSGAKYTNLGIYPVSNNGGPGAGADGGWGNNGDGFYPSVGGGGGAGIYSSITGSIAAYGGGGGGYGWRSASSLPTVKAPGGAGGGGSAGSINPAQNGTAGTANTGGGGGAGATGAAGGSGVCIIRWPTAYPDAPAVSGNTPTPAQPGYRVYRWNSGPGSITF